MASVVYISEEEAARDFGAIMKHIRSGDEVRLDCKDGVTAVVKRAETSEPVKVRKIDSPVGIPGKTIPEILESLSKWEAVHGPLIVDEGFAQDVAEAHERFNRPLDTARWD